MCSLIHHLRSLSSKSYCEILIREIIRFMYLEEHDNYFEDYGLTEQKERNQGGKSGSSDGAGARD